MKRMMTVACAVAMLAATGCQTGVPPEALSWTAETSAYRALSRRTYGISDERSALHAVTGVLQDLGYHITEGEFSLGFVTGTKAGKGAGGGEKFLFALLGGNPQSLVKERKVRATVATRLDGGGRLQVRATFNEEAIDGLGRKVVAEKIDDPALYQGFFAMLDKALYLEGQRE